MYLCCEIKTKENDVSKVKQNAMLNCYYTFILIKSGLELTIYINGYIFCTQKYSTRQYVVSLYVYTINDY